MTRLFIRFITDTKGQDLIEYALLGGFVSLAAVAGATALGGALNDWYDAVATTVSGL
jgi:Flp pilus assembly pilin Flp